MHPLDTSVYVHFPWCAKKCPYCDFATRGIEPAAVPHRRYADAILRELSNRAPSLEGRRLRSVFFGGGTPSLWESAELGRVLAGIAAAFEEKSEDFEVSAECNPSSFDRRTAEGLREAGVERVSLGLQSLRDHHLRFLGRLHDAKGAIAALREALRIMPRVSGDLMFGMPGQTVEELLEAIDTLADEGLRHVSLYALTIETGTRFGELHRRGRLPLADEEVFASIFEAAEARFSKRGLSHYEVSNYATPGEESRHNAHYWRGLPYLGLGAAAVGCLDEGVGAARRYRNRPDPSTYVAAIEAGGAASIEESEERLGPSELVREALMLGLRTTEGMSLSLTEARAGVDPLLGRERSIAALEEDGALRVEGDRLFVPTDRWLGLDSIVAELF